MKWNVHFIYRNWHQVAPFLTFQEDPVKNVRDDDHLPTPDVDRIEVAVKSINQW